MDELKFELEKRDLKTLVIHPEDRSTDFLCEIYSGFPEWKRVGNMPTEQLEAEIEQHDRIVMLGHGSPSGLFSTGWNIPQNLPVWQQRSYVPMNPFLVGAESTYLLRQKELVGIWCNANQFFDRYRLNGFYTGMIISEVMEANYCGLRGTSQQQVTESNILFSQAIKEAIGQPTIMKDIAEVIYEGQNPVIEYNKRNLYQR